MADSKSLNIQVRHLVKNTEAWAAETKVIPSGFLCIEIAKDLTITVGESTYNVPDGTVLTKVGATTGDKTFAQLPYTSDAKVAAGLFMTEAAVNTAISTAVNEAVSSVFTIKGIKATKTELDAVTDMKSGDVWFVGDAEATGADAFEEYVYVVTQEADPEESVEEVGHWEYFGKTSITLTPFVAATDSAAGTAGLVPAPAAGDNGKYLTNEGWAAIPNAVAEIYDESGNNTNENAKAGLITAQHQAALEELEGHALLDTDTLVLNCVL